MGIKKKYKLLPEPELAFSTGSSSNAYYPADGLARFGPLDKNVGSSSFSRITYGLIVKEGKQGAVESIFGNLQSKFPSSRLFPAYPGFKSVYKTDVNLSEDARIFISDNEVNDALSSPDPFVDIVELYTSKLDMLASSSGDFDSVLIYIPRNFESYIISRRRDLRAYLKALCIERRMYSQILRSGSFSPYDETDFRWNLSLGLYVAAKGEPWRLWEGFTGTVFVGVSFGIKKDGGESRVLIGTAEIFDKWGLSVAIKSVSHEVSEEEYYSEKGLYLPGDKTVELMKGILNDYQETTGESVSRVVIHKSNDFNEEEVQAISNSVNQDTEIDLLHLIDKGSNNIILSPAEDEGKPGFPPYRGTYWSIDDERFVLYTVGYVDNFDTYPGKGTPRPIEVRVCGGNTDHEKLAVELLGLTKMNWNTMRPIYKTPATLAFSRRVVELLKTNLVKPSGLRDFRLFV